MSASCRSQPAWSSSMSPATARSASLSVPITGRVMPARVPTCACGEPRGYVAGMSVFDDVDTARLRRRRTVKWSLYGPDVLAAWVAEMDFDTAPAVRAAIVEAVAREDFGYVEPDLGELTTACVQYM